MIKTVIFDIGKVLVGYDWDEFLMGLYGDKAICDRVKDVVFGHGIWSEVDRGIWSDEQILKAFVDIDPSLESEIHTFWNHLGQAIYLYDFTEDWLQELHDRGYQTLYLSNWSYHLLGQARTALRFIPLLDGGIFSCKVKLIKPDRAIYQAITDHYHLTPSECVFLDDKVENIQAAVDFGFHGIIVKNHDQALKELEALLA